MTLEYKYKNEIFISTFWWNIIFIATGFMWAFFKSVLIFHKILDMNLCFWAFLQKLMHSFDSLVFLLQNRIQIHRRIVQFVSNCLIFYLSFCIHSVNFIERNSNHEAIEHHFKEELNTFLGSNVLIQRFVGKFTVHIHELSIDPVLHVIVSISKFNETLMQDCAGKTLFFQMRCLYVRDYGTWKYPYEKRKYFIKG